ncbi:hypothetical protein WMO13_07505 [Ignatzschineria larvae DSM 13226]|uniref:Uncharacterized protein n=1 Tax=Ignatzschineria larvae DSM 13226 TaxID=1111732 RepID=A0ABZ3BXI0_9GAMM|nr:hypothetical protein [Ignatzschineria larvae]
MSNKKASLIAIIAVIVIFLIYDRFKPLSEEEVISKQGLVTLNLDNSYKNIDSTLAPEGTLLAQYSQRYGITAMVTGGHLTETEQTLSLEAYAKQLLSQTPDTVKMEITAVNPDKDELFYRLNNAELHTWQRLKRYSDGKVVIIAITSESENPSIDPLLLLQSAQFSQ